MLIFRGVFGVYRFSDPSIFNRSPMPSGSSGSDGSKIAFIKTCAFSFVSGRRDIFFFFEISVRIVKETTPIGSMYGISTYICHKSKLNVGKYTIHGS